MQRLLRYVELKSGHHDNGPASIGYVRTSRSGGTLYFDGKALKRAAGGSGAGNYVDLQSGESYWVSGVKRNGENRHWAGSGKVRVERSAAAELLVLLEVDQLDAGRFEIVNDFAPTDPASFYELENG